MKKYQIDKFRKGARVYGPYLRKDGRKHVVIVHPNKDGEFTTTCKKQTVSYPKWLMEQKLGRELDPDQETIDHKNDNFNDNKFRNLRILPRVQHSIEDALRVRLVKFKCIWCKKKFKALPKDKIRSAINGAAGPFCSRRCSGLYGASVQNGGQKLYYKKIPKRKWFKLKHFSK